MPTVFIESILDTIKKELGIELDDESFDFELCVHINSAISQLYQLGIGSKNVLKVTSNAETWHDLYGDEKRIEDSKNYIFLKVKLLFDPPANSFVVNAYKEQLDELTWRLNVASNEIEREKEEQEI